MSDPDNNNNNNNNNTNTDKNYTFNSKVAFLLIAVGSAALVITIYHCLTSTWRNRHNLRRGGGSSSPNPQEDAAELGAEEVGMSSYDESSTAQLFPAHKYQKGMEMGWAEEDVTCAICLSEFVEGEETKTLPICLHSYHAECIDMWLFSHSNCPMCRTDATPSPSPRVELGLGGGGISGGGRSSSGGGRSSSGSGTSTYSRSDHMLEMY